MAESGDSPVAEWQTEVQDDELSLIAANIDSGGWLQTSTQTFDKVVIYEDCS